MILKNKPIINFRNPESISHLVYSKSTTVNFPATFTNLVEPCVMEIFWIKANPIWCNIQYVFSWRCDLPNNYKTNGSFRIKIDSTILVSKWIHCFSIQCPNNHKPTWLDLTIWSISKGNTSLILFYSIFFIFYAFWAFEPFVFKLFESKMRGSVSKIKVEGIIKDHAKREK